MLLSILLLNKVNNNQSAAAQIAYRYSLSATAVIMTRVSSRPIIGPY